jgi:hypothetical protein
MRAKFRCESVTQFVAQENVELRPVTQGSLENNSFSKYTPAGKLEMCITNPGAIGFFQPGKEYYLDITPAN